MKRLKKFYKKFDVDTKKLYGDYVIKKPVFNFALGFILLLLAFALLTAPSDTAYFRCDNFDGCINPFYGYCDQNATDCKAETVTYGEWGTKVEGLNFVHNYFFLMCIGFVGLAFLFNHLKYNTGTKK